MIWTFIDTLKSELWFRLRKNKILRKLLRWRVLHNWLSKSLFGAWSSPETLSCEVGYMQRATDGTGSSMGDRNLGRNL
jgi:hypothetical protein